MPISKEEKAEFKKSINLLLALAESAHCNSLHHTKTQQHHSSEVCKAEYALCRAAVVVNMYLKNIGIL